MLSLSVCWWNKVIIKMLSSSLFSIIIIFFNQPFKLKFYLAAVWQPTLLVQEDFFYKSSRQLQNFRRHGNQHGRNLKSCQLFLPYCFHSFVLSSTLFLHSDLFRFLLFSGILSHCKSDRCFFTMTQIMSALKCAPPFNSFFHIRLHRTLLSFISFLFSFISFPVVLSSQISPLFFSFHFFISLSKQITGYLYSFSVCFPRGFASFFPFSCPNFFFFHMLLPAFPFPLFAAEISLS